MVEKAVHNVCIIGAGMIGSAAARYTSMKNLKVCLIGPDEPKTKDINASRDIFGAYYDESRIVSCSAQSEAWALLASRSIHRFRDIEKQSGIRFYEEVGCLRIGQKGGKEIEKMYELTKGNDNNVVMLDATTTMQQFPYIFMGENENAIWERNKAGFINPRKLVQAEQKLAEQFGCDILRDVVSKVSEVAHPYHNYKVMCLKTDQGNVLYSEKVLICTGSFTGCRDLLPEGIKPDVELVTQTIILAQLGEHDVGRMRNMPCMSWEDTGVGEESHGCYVLPPILYPNGKYYLKLGHRSVYDKPVENLDAVKSWYCNSPPEYIKDGLIKVLKHNFPGITPKSFETDTCVTCNTSNKLPFIDIVTPHIGVAMAGNGYGGKSSDEIGRIAVELLTNGKWMLQLPREYFQFRQLNTKSKVSKL